MNRPPSGARGRRNRLSALKNRRSRKPCSSGGVSIPGMPRTSSCTTSPTAGGVTRSPGARLKAEGVVAGVPDVFLASPRQGFHGLYIEMKRQKGGRLESSQKDIIARLRQAGYRVEVCKGWWEAREAIENYLIGALPQASGGRA